MPVFVDNQKREYFLSQKKELIDRDLLDCYNRLMEKQNPESVIRSHKLCINRMDIHGRNKYKTLNPFEATKKLITDRVIIKYFENFK